MCAKKADIDLQTFNNNQQIYRISNSRMKINACDQNLGNLAEVTEITIMLISHVLWSLLSVICGLIRTVIVSSATHLGTDFAWFSASSAVFEVLLVCCGVMWCAFVIFANCVECGFAVSADFVHVAIFFACALWTAQVKCLDPHPWARLWPVWTLRAKREPSKTWALKRTNCTWLVLRRCALQKSQRVWIWKNMCSVT